MKTKRAYLIQPGLFEIREDNLEPGPGEVLVKVAACGLCNWELNHWKGLLGTFPQTLGHEWAGEIVDIGAKVKSLKVGDRVTGLPQSLAGFSEYAVMTEESCFKLDKYVKLEYALGEPLKCIVTVLKATEAKAGDCGIVVGCGPMGLWSVQALAGKTLSSLIAIDVDDWKLELAKKYGATHVINPKNENAKKIIEDITGGRMADFVIEGTGVPAVLNSSIDYLKASGKGRLLLMSSHESSCKEFDFREAIGRGIEIHFPHPNYSYDQSDDMRRAVALINNGTFQVEELITHKFSLSDINEAFKTLDSKPQGYIKGIVIP